MTVGLGKLAVVLGVIATLGLLTMQYAITRGHID